MFNSMTPTVRQIIGPQTRTNAADLFIRASECFGISAAKERYLLVQELTTLKLRDNDWTRYLNRYREIQSRLEELNATKEDIEHDLFLIGLGSWNSTFVRTKLDEFFATGQRNQPIKNLNLRDLQGELSNRTQINSDTANQKLSEKSDQEDPKSDSEPEQSDSEKHKKSGMTRSRSPNKREGIHLNAHTATDSVILNQNVGSSTPAWRLWNGPLG